MKSLPEGLGRRKGERGSITSSQRGKKSPSKKGKKKKGEAMGFRSNCKKNLPTAMERGKKRDAK